MSIPNFSVRMNKSASHRGELTPDGQDRLVRSRLVGYQIGVQDENGDGRDDIGDPLVIQATYAVDRLTPAASRAQPGASSCLEITQQYKFYQGNPGQKLFGGPSLGTTGIGAAFYPIVRYDFHAQGSDRLAAVTIPERLNFQIDGMARNNAAVFRDFDGALGGALDAIANGLSLPKLKNQNPLRHEVRFTAIDRGKAGPWDNYHQTDRNAIDAPGLNGGVPTLPPGCPECVHIHWRWGSALDFPPSYRGNPIIPAGSDQTVHIGIARARGTDRPAQWRDTINGDTIVNKGIVFWYEGTGYQASDAFFIHGGFFEHI